VHVTGTRKTLNLVDPTRKYSEILRTCVVTYSQKRAAKQARLKAYTARTLKNNTLDCLFVCFLVVAEKRTNYFTLPVSFSAAHHHPLSQQLLLPDVNCRDIVRCDDDDDDDDDDDLRPGSGGVSGCEKRQKPPQTAARSTAAGIFDKNPIPYTDTRHTQRKENCNKRKETRDPTTHKEWAPQENQVNEPLFFTKQQQQSHYNRNQASKQAHNPSEFLLFSSKIIPESVVKSNTRKSPRESTGLEPRERGTEGASERGRAGGRAGGRDDRPCEISLPRKQKVCEFYEGKDD
jgi:hypothetical protein